MTYYMSEFRQDIVTKEWVLIAPNRSGRPHDFKRELATPEGLPEFLDSCVFCPGNEKQTPEEICRIPKSGNDWKVRVVPNKFGVLQLDGGTPQHNFYIRQPGIGSHEIVITKFHNQPTALQPVELIENTIEAYIERINALSKFDAVKYVHIIQNHGKLAGASLIHPHSQIFAMPFLGPHVAAELRGAGNYYSLFDKSIYDDILQHELSVKKRIVLETDRFVVFCPFESKMPYQMRIVPKKQEAKFENIETDDKRELAVVLKSALLKLYNKLGNPSYNYYIHTMPFKRSKNVYRDERAYRWHLVILPRINIWAGLELGTEIYVNVVPPEHAAEYLRGE